MKIVEESPHHIILQHPQGHVVKIAKAALSKKTLDKLKSFAEGGKVESEQPKGLKLDSEEAKKVSDGFNKFTGQTQTSQSSPKVAQSNVRHYAEGTPDEPVAATEVPDVEQIPVAERAPASSLLENVGKGFGKLVNYGEDRGADLIGAGKAIGQGVTNAASQVTEGFKKGYPSAATPASTDNKPMDGVQNAVDQGSAAGPMNVSLNGALPNQYPADQGQSQLPIPNYLKEYQGAIREQEQGIRGEADAEAKAAPEIAKAHEAQAQQQAALADEMHKNMQHVHEEAMRVAHEVENRQVDPNRFFRNQSTGSKFFTTLGLLVGGQPVAEMLQKQIDHDVDAQKSEIDNKKNALHAYLQEYGNMPAAENALRLAHMAAAEGTIKKIAANFGGQQAQAKSQQALGQLHAMAAPLIAQQGAQLAMMKQMSHDGSGADPDKAGAMAIKFLVPEKLQDAAYKEHTELVNVKKGGLSALNAFDKLDKMVAGGTLSPNIKKALIGPITTEISRSTAGRFTDTDFHILESLWPSGTDGPGTRAEKRKAIADLFRKKLSSSLLTGNHVPVPQMSESLAINGAPRRQMLTPVSVNR